MSEVASSPPRRHLPHTPDYFVLVLVCCGLSLEPLVNMKHMLKHVVKVARENTGRSVVFECQINREQLFYISIFHEIFVTYFYGKLFII